jgi:hypothetical protein
MGYSVGSKYNQKELQVTRGGVVTISFPLNISSS